MTAVNKWSLNKKKSNILSRINKGSVDFLLPFLTLAKPFPEFPPYFPYFSKLYFKCLQVSQKIWELANSLEVFVYKIIGYEGYFLSVVMLSYVNVPLYSVFKCQKYKEQKYFKKKKRKRKGREGKARQDKAREGKARRKKNKNPLSPETLMWLMMFLQNNCQHDWWIENF